MPNLQQWADRGWLRPHQPSSREISNLFAIVDRDLEDIDSEISTDWRFGIAYNAALKLCTILLNASGYRADRLGHHQRTIGALPLILGSNWEDDARYLDACRRKRNTVEYDMAGGTTEQDVADLADLVRTLRPEVEAWLKREHPMFLAT